MISNKASHGNNAILAHQNVTFTPQQSVCNTTHLQKGSSSNWHLWLWNFNFVASIQRMDLNARSSHFEDPAHLNMNLCQVKTMKCQVVSQVAWLYSVCLDWTVTQLHHHRALSVTLQSLSLKSVQDQHHSTGTAFCKAQKIAWTRQPKTAYFSLQLLKFGTTFAYIRDTNPTFQIRMYFSISCRWLKHVIEPKRFFSQLPVLKNLYKCTLFWCFQWQK